VYICRVRCKQSEPGLLLLNLDAERHSMQTSRYHSLCGCELE
jgi:hypothetical protein